MRLRSLGLVRYGKFTDTTIDFGERADGPDLHVVYGPNEAGKSTALAGFLDVLFGIEPRSRMNFLHPYPAMRITAQLELGGRMVDVCRIKRAQNSLLDGADRPVPEQLIQAHLAGLQRDSYRAMFSLDDETLEAGGEGILASRGDVGELLFSAGAGLADFSRALAELREAAEGYYKLHSRSGELATNKMRIAALKEQRDALDVVATDYARRVIARDRAKGLYDIAIAERAAIQARMESVQREVAALPRLASLRGLREKIATLAHLPEVPADWRTNLPSLQKEEVELSARLEGADRAIAVLQAEIANISVDEATLTLGARVDGWADMRARAMTAKDIPERQREARQEELAIAGILSRLGQAGNADPRALVLAAPIMGQLRALLETRSGLDAAAVSARRELTAARRALEDGQTELKGLFGGAEAASRPAPMQALGACLATVRADDFAARARVAARARASHAAEASERMAALLPWQGDAAALAGLRVPDAERLRAWQESLTAARELVTRHDAELVRFRDEKSRLRAEAGAIEAAMGVASEQQAARLRGERETAWAVHRRTLNESTAELFEHALRQDDFATNARLLHERQAASLVQLNRQLAIVSADEARVRAALESAGGDVARVEMEVSAYAGLVSPEWAATTSLGRFDAWLRQRDKVLETLRAMRLADADERAALADGAAAHTRLRHALQAADVVIDAQADIDNLAVVAQEALRRQDQADALRRQIEARTREVRAREAALTAAEAEDAAWRRDWVATCGGTWLSPFADPPQVAPVREILEIVGELGPALDRVALLEDRIEKMRFDEIAFGDEVIDAARSAGLAAEGAAPLELDRRLTALVQETRSAHELKAARTRALEQTQAQAKELHAAIELHRRRVAEMTERFGVSSLAEVATALRDIERREDWRAQAEAAEREVTQTLHVGTLEEAETILARGDETAFAAEFAELRTRFNDQDQRARELHTENSKAMDALAAVGGDDAVARLEEQRRTVLLEIEAGARRYLKLRAGIAAAEHALRAYREQHQSPMMKRASEAFRIISREAYLGLAAQRTKDTEVLVALAASGGSKIASELSKGTRFQLYLALRVAGYHEFATRSETVPFIADDIMETFDDFRAEEAFRLFAGMAEVGQVIYMTHHRHLCDIARRLCPHVRIHALTDS
jgi:uncharacterized protein YhaN